MGHDIVGEILKEDGDKLLADSGKLLLESAYTPLHTRGTRFIASRWPVTDGLTAETTSQTGHKINLVPTMGTFVPRRYRV